MGAVISSIKIGASTEIQNLKDKGIPNAFVLKSGKRQWVLQASSARDYQIWQTQMDNMLKQFGTKVSGNTGSDEKKENGSDILIGIGPSGNTQQTDKYKQQNLALKEQLDALHGQMEGMQRELDRLKVLHSETGDDNKAMIQKVEAEFAKEKDALIRDYELQSQNLTDQLQELHRQIDAKTPMDGGGYLKGFRLGTEDVFKSEIDTEKKILDTFTEDERATIKFMHKHLHRHTHRHTHNHKHIHLHKDAADNVDNVDIQDLELVNKHTISHTITHSNTQFQIKKAFF